MERENTSTHSYIQKLNLASCYGYLIFSADIVYSSFLRIQNEDNIQEYDTSDRNSEFSSFWSISIYALRWYFT